MHHTPFGCKARRVLNSVVIRPRLLDPDDSNKENKGGKIGIVKSNKKETKTIRVGKIVKHFERQIESHGRARRDALLTLMMSRREVMNLKIRNAFVQWKLYVSKSRSDSLERILEHLAVEKTRRENAERALSYYRACDGSEWGKVCCVLDFHFYVSIARASSPPHKTTHTHSNF